MSRQARLLALIVMCLTLGTVGRAHQVVVDQVVDMTIQPRDGVLLVHLHVPASAVAAAKLPTREDGTLDASAADSLLDVVAADIARNLDVWEDGAPLPAPRVSSTIGVDQSSLDIGLTYGVGNVAGPFSARLNAFSGTPLAPVRTDVRYAPSSGPEQTMSIRGEPVRITFDPTLAPVLQDFAIRALRSVLESGDPLLFLACLLLPMRRLWALGELFAAMVAGQVVTIAGSAFAPGAVSAMVPAVAVVASSAVVIAALQSVVKARRAWTLALAMVFGLMSGLVFGATCLAARPFAGSHGAAAVLLFLVVVLASQLWLAALGWGVRIWLDGLGAPERILTFLAAALIIHTALDRTADHAAALEAATGFGALEAMAWLTVGWSTVIVLTALVEAGRQRIAGGVSPDLAGSARA